MVDENEPTEQEWPAAPITGTHVEGLKRLRADLDERQRIKLGPAWRAMKACAKNSTMQVKHGQPPFPAYTTYLKLANVMDEFKLPCERFCALAEGPGSMALYLLRCYPHSTGVGLTLPDHNLQWSWLEPLRNNARFTALEGDVTAEDADCRVGTGFDLVIADGGLAEKVCQEAEAHLLLAGEAQLASRILALGGNFVIKIYDTFLKATQEMVWALAHVFRIIHISHGVAVRQNNAERYLVCMGFRGRVEYTPPAFSETFLAFMRKANQRAVNLHSACQASIALGLDAFPESVSESDAKLYFESL